MLERGVRCHYIVGLMPVPAPALPRRFARLLAALGLVCSWAPGRAAEVSQQPPPIYRETLAAWLTPVEDVLRAGAGVQASEHDGVILLDEEFHYIDAKGRRFMVDHTVVQALTDSGAKEIAETIRGYRKSNQKIHLVLARTILPDGKRMPVRPGAAILQTPQRQADDAIYDDAGELRLIFPNVKPGAITESIIVIEESQFRIPGEFTAAFSWAFGWPAKNFRRVVEMPAALGERLKITAVGRQAPELAKAATAKNRTRWTWTLREADPQPNETNRPPALQAGPVLWLTTLPDWTAFVQWYAPLVSERSSLRPALARQIDEWTKNARTPAEILEILMAKVSTDVRYTGLEFGTSDLQPHDCNEVWENQYGDCKDKANLLRVMLRHKNINASLALLNAEHAGLIERRSPDFRQFDHAILAVETAPGQYVFCDPTISYAKPGMLSPGDADRDTLLIRPGPAEWVRTPPQDAGTTRFDFDLKLAEDGGLSGWLTQENSGYYGVADADFYQRLDKDRLVEKARGIVRGFFKGAEIVDVTKTALEKWDGVYRLKMYFVVPGGGQDAGSLAFPQSSALFVNPGAKKNRTTPFYLWRETTQVTARIKLPEGRAPSGLPHPLRIATPAFDGAAEWKVEGQECRATLDLHLKQKLIPPEQFEGFSNALVALHAWLDRPLVLAAAGEKKPAPAAETVTLEDFPVMPTGLGQIELVERRFPASGDAKLRREALEKVRQYFPTDKPALFQAGVKLASMDWTDGQAQQASGQIRDLLRTYRESLDAEDAAWGEYMLAITLKDAGQTDEALKLFERIGSRTQLSPPRRAWSAYQRARIHEAKSATAAIKALRECLALESEAQPAGFTLLAKLLLVDGRSGDLKKEVKQLLGKKPPQLVAILTRLAESAGELLPADKAAQRAELMQILEGAEKSADLGPRFAEALGAARESIRAAGVAERIRDSLKKHLAAHPVAKPAAAPAELKSPADFARAIAAAEKNGKPELAVAYGLELLTRFEPDADFSNHLWIATNHADWKERVRGEPEPLLPMLLGLCDQLPPDTDAHVDGKLLRAQGCARRGDLAGAQKIHEDLLRQPQLAPGFRVAVLGRLAGNFETRRDYRKALEIYQTLEAEIKFGAAKNALLRAVFLQLAMGGRDEALRVLGLLGDRPPDALRQAGSGAQIIELTALAKDKAKAAAYWDAAAKWWPAWLALEEKFGLKPLGDELLIPAIPDLADFGAGIGTAVRGKDRAAFFAALRQIAHAARWQPGMTIELFSIIAYVPPLAPALAGDVRKFAITVFENFASDDPELQRKNQLFGAAHCIDTAQSARALEIVRAFHEKPPVDDAIAHAMARLWALAAQGDKGELPKAAAALEKTLASPNLREDRALSVGVLADLYRRAGRTEDEEKLLRRELENPQIKAVAAGVQQLTARLDQLAQTGEESRRFATAVANWVKKCAPAWWAFAEPKSLDDPRLANLEAVLKIPGQSFVGPEIIKLQVLATTAPTLSYESRQRAFLEALTSLAGLARTSDETRALYDAVLADADFPEPLRTDALWRAMVDARYEERAADFAALRTHPLAAKLGDRAKSAIEIYRSALAVDTTSPEAIVAYCEQLLAKEINPSSLDELRLFQLRLVAMSQTEAAEKIYRGLGDAVFDSEVESGKAALQMEFLKAQTYAKKWAPLISAMRALVLARHPADTIKEPEIYGRLSDRRDLDWIEEGVAQQVRLWQIKTWRTDLGNFAFWRAFVLDLPPGDASRKLAFDLIAAALEHAPGDTERAGAILFANGAIDGDNAELRRTLADLIKPYRQAENFPATYGQIRMHEFHVALRTGGVADFDRELAGVPAAGAAAFGNMIKLRHYVQKRDLPALRKTLESISPDELLSERLLAYALRAFELTGMKDELALARTAAKKAVYRGVLAAWVSLDPHEFFRAYDLVDALHDSTELPRDWFKSSTAQILNRRASLSIRASDDYQRQDWPALLQTADEAIKALPTYYHFYWFRGEALYRLDRQPEAVEPLRIYVRHARDELEFPLATERLRELEPAAPPPAAEDTP